MNSLLKKAILVAMLAIVAAPCLAQQRQTVSFGYDDNGNRTSRDIRVTRFDGDKGDGSGNDILLAVDEVFEEAQVSVFPNPARDAVTISVKHNTISFPMQVTLLTQNGEVLEQRTTEDSSTTIRFGSYAAGIYLLVVEVKGKTQAWEIVKD